MFRMVLVLYHQDIVLWKLTFASLLWKKVWKDYIYYSFICYCDVQLMRPTSWQNSPKWKIFRVSHFQYMYRSQFEKTSCDDDAFDHFDKFKRRFREKGVQFVELNLQNFVKIFASSPPYFPNFIFLLKLW